MKNKTNRLLAACLFVILTTSGLRAADLSESDKQFLNGYEQIRAALAADNLADAKKSAAVLGDEGAPVAKSDSLTGARKEFTTLSERAIKLAAGQNGYYVVNCPMLKKDWVQTSDKIANPYAGSSMLTCGVIRKKAN